MGNERERLEKIGKAIKDKRAEMDANKATKDKQDKISTAVKKLTKAEFDALPKSLQKEVKEYR